MTKWIGVLTAIVMCVFGLTSCGSDDDGGVNPSQFVGVWQATNVSGWELIDGEKEYFDEDLSGNRLMTVYSDGTFEESYNGVIESAGTWSINGNTYTSKVNGRTIRGKISISGDIAIIEVEASDVYNKWTYKRISKDVSK